MSAYLVATGNVRSYPRGSFTSGVGITRFRRLNENLTVYALAINFGLPVLASVSPALVQVAGEIEEERQKGQVVAGEPSLRTVARALSLGFRTYADIFVQSAIAYAFMAGKDNKSLGANLEARVFIWDMKPSLPHKYVGDFLRFLKVVPKFVIDLLLTRTLSAPRDLAFFSSAVTPLAAFEDSLKANSIVNAANVIVDTAKILVRGETNPRKRIARVVINSVCNSFACAVGASIGRYAFADVGEYWGEAIGENVGARLGDTVAELLGQ